MAGVQNRRADALGLRQKAGLRPRPGGAAGPLTEISTSMDPEEGHLWVIGVGDDQTPAFTQYGIECLKRIIIEERALLKRKPHESS